MRRFFAIMVCLFLLVCLFPGSVSATDNARTYDFVLTADGKQETTVTPDQIITVSLVLNRTDSDEAASMYALQAELVYDDTFFELVDGSALTSVGVAWTDMARRTGGRAFYLNFLSLSGGEVWQSQVQVGTFRLRVIAQSGTSEIRSENCIVSVADGTDAYASTANHVKVVVSTDCTVSFESSGGSKVDDQIVSYREKLTEPAEPTREGYRFNGWYRDIDKTQLWNFDTDVVEGNMTLYAGWVEDTAPIGEQEDDSFPYGIMIAGLALIGLLLIFLLLLGKKKVTFDTCGATPIDPVYVKKGARISRPMTPVKAGAVFLGWYTAADGGTPWNFERGRVKKSMTLYARWK